MDKLDQIQKYLQQVLEDNSPGPVGSHYGHDMQDAAEMARYALAEEILEILDGKK